MIKHFATRVALPLFLFTSAISDAGSPVVYKDPSALQLATSYFCLGDSYGDFVNDYVAVLSDGSAWKVHPEDSQLYGEWNLEDQLHLQIRTSFYWFKREHKFELQNLTRNEKVRVMLMQYPTFPLMIIASQEVEVGGEYHKTQVKDSHTGTGREEYHWHPKLMQEIYLSDGSVWRIKKQYASAFKVNHFVYLSVHRDVEECWCFLITGKEREAVWTKADRVL